jgi:uncharacterized repeat protein (TIGR03803 family)
MTHLRTVGLLILARTQRLNKGGVRKVVLAKTVCAVFVLCVTAAIASPAQTSALYSFCSQTNCTDGAYPLVGLIQATDGNFYGTTAFGGGTNVCNYGIPGCGTVFQITPGGALTTLHAFNFTDGGYPKGLIQGTDGNFYGTTTLGGTASTGTVFKITAGGTLTTLYSFCSQTNCSDGAYPRAGLIQGTDGDFYGTTSGWSGQSYVSTVFRITPAGTLTTLYRFCSQTNCTDGLQPFAGLIQGTDGNFYGTTNLGGTAGQGTIFKITPAGTLTTLYSFCSQTNCSDGTNPRAGLIQGTDGNFYGTTNNGGAHDHSGCEAGNAGGCGTVFKITPAGTLTTLYSFCSQTNCSDGADPEAGGLIQATDGNFYGTTSDGDYGLGYGTVFEIIPTGTLLTLHRFAGSEGLKPFAGLIQATDGNFYGTTTGGGAEGWGTVFRLSASPAVTLIPSTLNFGNQALDETSAAKKVTLKNSGTALLIVSSVAIEGSSFVISANTCGVLAPGKTCKVSVTFTPPVLGKLTGTLTFTDNAPNSPQTVSLSGTGVEPATLTPAGAAFGTWAVGATSTAKTFVLTNNQTVALTSIAISTTGDFAVSATTCTTSLAAKGKCTINVTFTPTALGTRTGQLNVSDSASNSPQTSTLTGAGK